MPQQIRGNQVAGQTLTRDDIERDYTDDGSLRAEDLPYDAAQSIKEKIDDLGLDTIDTHAHAQPVAANVWHINHQLSTTSIQASVFTASDILLLPDKVQLSGANDLSIYFTASQDGRAVIMGRVATKGNRVDAYNYTHGVTASRWDITHNLSSKDVLVSVFNTSDEMILPDVIRLTGEDSMTISFADSRDGKAVVIANITT